MKIESKRKYYVGGEEFDSREDAKRFAEYGGYGDMIEPYLEAKGLKGAVSRADLTTRTRIVNILVDYFNFVDEQPEPQYMAVPDKQAA